MVEACAFLEEADCQETGSTSKDFYNPRNGFFDIACFKVLRTDVKFAKRYKSKIIEDGIFFNSEIKILLKICVNLRKSADKKQASVYGQE